MALIKCPECGKDISDKAFTCPGCGYPMKTNDATITFDPSSWKSSICRVFDLNGRELISCQTGETMTVYCSRPKTVTVTMNTAIGQPSITVVPGGKYKAWINGMGHACVKEIKE